MPASPARLVWFRRDLRAHDHAALDAALAAGGPVHCAFVYDREILDALPSRRDRRVEFIHACLAELDATLRAHGGGLIVLHARARDAIPALAARLGAAEVHAARDYEPAAIERDEAVAEQLRAEGRSLVLHKDQVIFERDEVLTGAGRPFSVFTPYRNAWVKRLVEADFAARPTELGGGLLAPPPSGVTLPSLADIGFERTNLAELKVRTGASGARAMFDEFLGRIGDYKAARDFPAVRGPSYLSVHLRFGTLSVREAARAAHALSKRPETAEGAFGWLNELVWREFYFQVLWHHPRVVRAAFRPEYDRIAWHDDEGLFRAWCDGRTGYPLVDAAMAQINTTGWMHNRLRMVVASFLTKDLGIDWRRGERYFADQLNDFDLSANNGGWQWAASSGCDAQPYFRIFNPVSQSEKFDPQGKFIRRYLPALANLPDKHLHAPWMAPPMVLQAAGVRLGETYPMPVVDHAAARERTLARYAVVKGAGGKDAGAAGDAD